MTDGKDRTGVRPHGSGFRARLQRHGKRAVTRVVETEEEALADRDALRVLLRQKRPPAKGGTVRDLGNRWLPTRKNLRAYANDRSRWENHVLPHDIADMAVTAVTRGDVKAWLRDLEPDLPAWKSRDNCRALLTAFFEELVDDEVLQRNPCKGVRVKGEKSHVNVDEYATPDEQQAVLFAAPLPDRFLMAFAMGSSLRRDEVFSLHIADVHPNASEPHVLVRYGSRRKGEWLTPKNKRVRFVRLFGLALDAVRAQLAYLDATAHPNPEGLLFPTITGAKRDKPPASWETARAACGRTRLRWHSLRHVCATTLLFGWWDGVPWRLEDVSMQLGHSGLAVTQRYAKLVYVAHQWTKAPYIPKLFKDSDVRPIGVQVPKVAPASPRESGEAARTGATEATSGRARHFRAVSWAWLSRQVAA